MTKQRTIHPDVIVVSSISIGKTFHQKQLLIREDKQTLLNGDPVLLALLQRKHIMIVAQLVGMYL